MSKKGQSDDYSRGVYKQGRICVREAMRLARKSVSGRGD